VGTALSAVSLLLLFGITTVECTSQGAAIAQGECVLTRPVWPLGTLLTRLALLVLSFFLGKQSDRSAEHHLSSGP